MYLYVCVYIYMERLKAKKEKSIYYTPETNKSCKSYTSIKNTIPGNLKLGRNLNRVSRLLKY